VDAREGETASEKTLKGPEPAARFKPFPRFRNTLADFTALATEKSSFHILTTVDVSAWMEFALACKAQRRVPPSVVAYVARCLGVVLAKNPEMMAARLGNQLMIPGAVNLMVTMEAKTSEGDLIPLLMKIGTVDTKNLAVVSEELRDRARFLKRTPINSGRLFQAARWFAGCPAWMRHMVYSGTRRLPGTKRHLANFYTHVGLVSTTQFTRGHPGWGLSTYPFTISVVVGGLCKRAVVVNDEVAARECLDIAFAFDHAILDGAPATRFVADMSDEIESGRLLDEFLIQSE
jgi:hypothetical protein